MKAVFLDAYNLMHRSRFGVRDGENFIVYNFFRSLRPLVELLEPDKIFLVLEGHPAARHDLDESYKANRVAEEGSDYWKELQFLREQKKVILDLINLLPVTVLRHPDLECDDVIMTLAKEHETAGDEVIIVSTDTDYLQVASDRVRIYNPVSKAFRETPDFDYALWKSLRGDKADNITPVPGATDGKAKKLCGDAVLLEKFLNEAPERREIFEKNRKLIGYMTADHAGINRVAGAKNLSELRKRLTSMRFFSMTNDTSWRRWIKSFESIND
jgi:5'-3' exonuclease